MFSAFQSFRLESFLFEYEIFMKFMLLFLLISIYELIYFFGQSIIIIVSFFLNFPLRSIGTGEIILLDFSSSYDSI
jgi:hypothetical protein